MTLSAENVQQKKREKAFTCSVRTHTYTHMDVGSEENIIVTTTKSIRDAMFPYMPFPSKHSSPLCPLSKHASRHHVPALPVRADVSPYATTRQLSKRLTYALRHGSEKLGLNLRSDGFVSLDELLSKPNFSGVTLQQVQQVVSTVLLVLLCPYRRSREILQETPRTEIHRFLFGGTVVSRFTATETTSALCCFEKGE